MSAFNRRDGLRIRATTRVASAALVAALAVFPGCGYTVRPPYNETVQTIYLPITKPGNRFRQDLNIQFAELLRKEITDRTPYRVVGNPENADVTLESVVLFDNKNVQVENPYNLPRHILATMSVNVRLIDNRMGLERRKTLYPESRVSESATFDPEIGEPTRVGFAKVMDKLARDVVNMLEEPWGENEPAAFDMGEAGADDPTADRLLK